MVCSICGRSTNNEEAHFCEYCGNSFREHTPIIMSPIPRVEVNQIAEKPITFLNWLGTFGALILCIFIPLVGPFIPIAILSYFGFNSKVQATKKNWARAMLVLYGVLIVISFAVAASMLNNPEFQNYMQQFMKDYGANQ